MNFKPLTFAKQQNMYHASLCDVEEAYATTEKLVRREKKQTYDP